LESEIYNKEGNVSGVTLHGVLLLLLLLSLMSCRPSKTLVLPNYSDQPDMGKVDGEFSMMTYNIKALSTKPVEEVDAIIKFIKRGDFDVVLLQEVFSEKNRKQLTDSLSGDYPNIMERVDYGGWASLWQDAGLMILSKYKIVNLKMLDLGKSIKNRNGFQHMMLDKEVSVSLDAFANKSIASMLLDMGAGKHLLACTTHAQAFGSPKNRRRQFEEMNTYIETISNAIIKNDIVKPDNLTVLLTGDLNIHGTPSSDYDKMLSLLGGSEDLYLKQPLEKKEPTFAAGIFNMLLRFDYMLAWPLISEYNLNVPAVKKITVADVKVEGISISDHYPVVGILSF